MRRVVEHHPSGGGRHVASQRLGADRGAAPGAEDTWLAVEGHAYAHRLLPGSGGPLPPTLFVSGAFQTMDSWARFARRFAAEGSVLLVDPPGMGASRLLPPDRGVDLLAAALVGVLDHRGVERVNVVAASYGTPSAFRLAQLHPHRVGRIALAGTMAAYPPHLLERTRRTMELARSRDRRALADEVVEGLLCRDPHRVIDRRDLAERVLRAGILRMSDEALDQYATNTARLLRRPHLEPGPLVDGPEALVFTGEHDCFTLPEACREVAGAFTRSWFTLVRRADHLLHIEQFEVVVDLLLRFVRGAVDEPSAGCTGIERAGSGRPVGSGT